MKVRPILFNGAMVRANLSGTKTQTRRLIKNAFDLNFETGWPLGEDKCGVWRRMPCPLGNPGDLIWCRENFQTVLSDGFKPSEANYKTGVGLTVNYVATDGRIEFIDCEDEIKDSVTPSIHMPRWASRTTLKITDVRVQRLQEIDDADSTAEGVYAFHSQSPGFQAKPYYKSMYSPSELYQQLWELINGPGSWKLNPWVWAITYEVIKQNVDEYINGVAP